MGRDDFLVLADTVQTEMFQCGASSFEMSEKSTHRAGMPSEKVTVRIERFWYTGEIAGTIPIQIFAVPGLSKPLEIVKCQAGQLVEIDGQRIAAARRYEARPTSRTELAEANSGGGAWVSRS